MKNKTRNTTKPRDSSWRVIRQGETIGGVKTLRHKAFRAICYKHQSTESVPNTLESSVVYQVGKQSSDNRWLEQTSGIQHNPQTRPDVKDIL